VVEVGLEHRRHVLGQGILAREVRRQEVPHGAVQVLAVDMPGALSDLLINDPQVGLDDALLALARGAESLAAWGESRKAEASRTISFNVRLA
jgi:hypothetical protein